MKIQKIQLALRGGSYGELQLQPIDTTDPSVSFPDELLALIRSPALEAYRGASDTTSAAHRSDTDPIQTGLEVYELTISDAEGHIHQYSMRHSELERNPDLKKLIDFIWSVAKPVPHTG